MPSPSGQFGGTPPRPLNAPQGPTAGIGVQAGVTGGEVLARLVIVFGTNAGVFVYNGTPSASNPPIASMTEASTDPYGNPVVTGVATYVTIAAVLYALRLGLSTVSGSPTPAFFLHNMGGSPPSDDPAYSFGNANSSGAATVMYSGKATAGSAASYIECADSTLSGVGGGAIVVQSGTWRVDAAGNMTVTGTLSVNGSGSTATGGLADGTINGTSAAHGLTDGTINGTSGGASAGTAHTHGPGSYAVANGQHSHASGTYAVANGTHSHVL